MIGRESISLGSLGTLQAMSQSPDTNYSRPSLVGYHCLEVVVVSVVVC